MLPPSLLVISQGMGADRSSTARVQRGPSEAARCASKNGAGHSVSLFPLNIIVGGLTGYLSGHQGLVESAVAER